MALSDAERERFVAWLEADATTLAVLVEQFSNNPLANTVLAKTYQAEVAAQRLIAAKLKSMVR